MLTWVTFPAYVALFSLLIYYIGYKLRAGETEWSELHLVDILPRGEQAEWRGRTYASVYSPVNARYKVVGEQRQATLRGEFMSSWSGSQEGSRAEVLQRARDSTRIFSCRSGPANFLPATGGKPVNIRSARRWRCKGGIGRSRSRTISTAR